MVTEVNNSWNGIDFFSLALVLATIGLCYYTKELVENKRIEHWFKIYFEYNKRFSEIMMRFSDLKSAHPEQVENCFQKNLLPLMTSYFNLCLEEYTLEKKSLVKDKQLWEQWRQGIINYMGDKDFRSSWDILRNNKCYPEEFRIYMDNLKDNANQEEIKDI